MSRWHPTPFLHASFALHVAAAGLAALRPTLWPWAVGSLVANHAALAAAGLWPRSSLLGSNWTQLPAAARLRREIAITVDDGPDPEITPRVLEILGQHAAHATFFCIGARVAAAPGLAREIVRAGHAIENHSQTHGARFSLLGPQRMGAEIATAQQVIAAAVGEPPRFFRAPAGLRNAFLDPILARERLQLASWTRRGFDTVTRQPRTVLTRLANGLSSGDILLLHDGHAARTGGGRALILEVLPELLAALRAAELTPVTLRAAA
jgi:peptidoglycan/xylan/chitin deacetylase (PgdA/CDA1 family)